jgi:hypothetical protein
MKIEQCKIAQMISESKKADKGKVYVDIGDSGW